MNGGVVVVGSLHLDVVVTAPRLPAPDETLMGEAVTLVCGGKGGNQAVAASHHGAPTTMLGRVGGDVFAASLVDHLHEAGVDTSLTVVVSHRFTSARSGKPTVRRSAIGIAGSCSSLHDVGLPSFAVQGEDQCHWRQPLRHRHALLILVENLALRALTLNSFLRPPLPMTVLMLGSSIPLRSSVTARSPQVTVIVSAPCSSMRSRNSPHPASRLRHQQFRPRWRVLYLLRVDVRFIGRIRRRFRTFKPVCPSRTSRTNDFSVHGRSRPGP